MKINIIVATDKNGLFSSDGKIPWRDTTDLKRFKELTAGGAVVMGRKTFESLPRKLSNRTHIVLTCGRSVRPEVDILPYYSMAPALADLAVAGFENVWICGGQDVYNESLSYADSIYRTVVKGEYPPGEDSRYFHVPETGWKLVSSEPYENGVFEIYKRGV